MTYPCRGYNPGSIPGVGAYDLFSALIRRLNISVGIKGHGYTQL